MVVSKLSTIETLSADVAFARLEGSLTIPRPPALLTALASSAYPTHCIPP